MFQKILFQELLFSFLISEHLLAIEIFEAIGFQELPE